MDIEIERSWEDVKGAISENLSISAVQKVNETRRIILEPSMGEMD